MSAAHVFWDLAQAKVEDAADPEKRGRIRVSCGKIGNAKETLDDWIAPEFPYAGSDGKHGWFFLPSIGDQVLIRFVTGSTEDDIPGESFIRAPQYRWLAVFYPDLISVPETFRQNYGKRFGIVMPSGSVLLFDEADKEIILDGAKLRVGIESATEPLVCGTLYKTHTQTVEQRIADLADEVERIATALKTHTHPTAVGPTGPPVDITSYVTAEVNSALIESDFESIYKPDVPNLLSDYVFTSKTR